ncbi:MAG TPA: YicC/YloC family endoribonuclease [Thermoanaerobaculia bacterium]|nr:YicC/YloC family endoribonuclease [Thermoanaerobaculia bacterium]
MIQSMTGFGRASGSLSKHSVEITVKSVNHRNLELSVRLPEILWDMESAIRALAAEQFSRGKVDLSVRLHRTTEPEYQVVVNSRLANVVVPQLRAIAEEQGLGSSFSGSDLMRIPDLVSVQPIEVELEDQDRDALKLLIREACANAGTMRAREGDALRSDIVMRVGRIEESRAELEALREAIIAEALDAFRVRVSEISKVAGVEVREERLAQEVVLMVEKGDVAEELTRMGIHLTEIRAVIDGKEPAGKKLDFLSQELLREINTAGSKSRSSTIRSVVVKLKTEVERIREQVQNVE